MSVHRDVNGPRAAESWSPAQREVVEAINAYLNAWNEGDAEGILEHYRTVFQTPPPEGVQRRLDYEITSVRMVTGRLAIVDASYRVIGVGPLPDRPFEGLNTVVLIKENGKWLRTAHRNWISPRPEPTTQAERFRAPRIWDDTKLADWALPRAHQLQVWYRVAER